MRSLLGLLASGLAGIAGVVASQDGDGDFVPFFVVLTFAGGVAAWAAHPPFEGTRRRFARAIGVAWVGIAVWAGLLLAMSVTVWNGEATSSVPSTDATYIGLPATAYYVIRLYAGAVLTSCLAFARLAEPINKASRSLTSRVPDA